MQVMKYLLTVTFIVDLFFARPGNLKILHLNPSNRLE